MLTRCAFRVAELSEGFKGHIWYNEVDYMILEGAMVSVCVLLLTLVHPGFGFSGRYHHADFKLRLKKNGS
jgi:RTA1 like protein